MKQAYVTLKIENSIGYIEFFHPNRNSMPSDVLSQLEHTIIDAGLAIIQETTKAHTK